MCRSGRVQGPVVVVAPAGAEGSEWTAAMERRGLCHGSDVTVTSAAAGRVAMAREVQAAAKGAVSPEAMRDRLDAADACGRELDGVLYIGATLMIAGAAPWQLRLAEFAHITSALECTPGDVDAALDSFGLKGRRFGK